MARSKNSKKQPTLSSFELDGHTFHYNLDVLKSYSFWEDLAKAEERADRFFKCTGELFCGRQREYVEAAGGTIKDCGRLVQAVMKSPDAKKYFASSNS